MAVISYKCPNCGGELIFDPASQKYLCEYCISNFTQAELEKMHPDMAEEAVLYTCPSCGAEIATDETTAAAFCYYCHNPVVLSGKLSGERMPDHIIPFQIDRKTAETKFLDYVQKKKFIPKAFFDKKQIDVFSGVYFPYWVCDCQMQSDLSANAVRIRKWFTGDMEFTETKSFHIERKGTIILENIPKNALRKANRMLAEGVFPYHMADEKEFHMGYLSGFQAECRDIEKEALLEEVHREAKESGSQLLKDTIDSGYTGVQINNQSCHITKEKWKYTLLPVWTVTYRGRNGKVYYYSMNGQTGNVVGELPLDRKKVFTLGGAVTAAVFAAALIGGFFL
ncbi:MAG: TFIIB-type zinc ribbon-containing protein [Lachnospiraceae bacterium]